MVEQLAERSAPMGVLIDVRLPTFNTDDPIQKEENLRRRVTALSSLNKAGGVLVDRPIAPLGPDEVTAFIPATGESTAVADFITACQSNRVFPAKGQSHFDVRSLEATQLQPDEPSAWPITRSWIESSSNHAGLVQNYLGFDVNDLDRLTPLQRTGLCVGVRAILDPAQEASDLPTWRLNIMEAMNRLETIAAIALDRPPSPIQAVNDLQGFFRSAFQGDVGHDDLSVVEQLALIGPNKAMGYHSLASLRCKGPDTADKLVALARSKGNEAIVVSGADGAKTYGGSLTIYSPQRLQQLIDADRQGIARQGWPLDAASFARKTAFDSANAETQPTVYRVLAEAFGDSRPALRSSTYDRMLQDRDAFRANGGLDAAVAGLDISNAPVGQQVVAPTIY